MHDDKAMAIARDKAMAVARDKAMAVARDKAMAVARDRAMAVAPSMGLRRPAAIAALLAVELLAISLAYQHGFDFECRARASAVFCGALSSAVLRAIAITAALALIATARPLALRAMAGGLRPTVSRGWLAAHGAGFLCLMAPWGFLTDAATPATFGLAIALWLGGAALAAVGGALALAPARTWLRAAAAAGPGLPVGVALAAISPEIAAELQTIWRWSPITYATFHSAAFLLRMLGEEVISVPADVLLQVGGFGVLVGKECSGVEGIVLITSFVGLYLYLFRDQLRFPRAFLLLPVAIAASWTLNIVRIVTLIQIGAHVSPELAVNGFHSHAGWLMFTTLALTLTLAAHNTPLLRRPAPGDAAGAAPAPTRHIPPPLAEDWNAAQLLPFVVFMTTALLASTFLQTPAVAYPLRFVATLAALLVFHRLYRALDWRIDRLALGAGVAIGVIWLAVSPAPDDADGALAAALAAMPAWAFALWAATRILGTSLLVPMVEELVFRGYLLSKLDRGGPGWRIAALVVSTGLFAALHGRWIEAGLAGLVFALLTLRSGRLTDAIVAHAAANAIIAGWAVATGRWDVI